LAWLIFRRKRPSMNPVRLAITLRPARSLRTYTLWSRTEARYRSFESARFLGPLPEPDVPITEHPALHKPVSMVASPIDAAWSGSPVPWLLPLAASTTERSCSRTASWHSNSTAADLLPPFALWTAFPSPLVGRDSHD